MKDLGLLSEDYPNFGVNDGPKESQNEIRRESMVSRASLLEAEEQHEFSKSIVNSFWFSLGALMQQGTVRTFGKKASEN